jgi:hypothetical protein
MNYDKSFGSPFKGPNGMSLNENDPNSSIEPMMRKNGNGPKPMMGL